MLALRGARAPLLLRARLLPLGRGVRPGRVLLLLLKRQIQMAQIRITIQPHYR